MSGQSKAYAKTWYTLSYLRRLTCSFEAYGIRYRSGGIIQCNHSGVCISAE
jgi:hypothetical protein